MLFYRLLITLAAPVLALLLFVRVILRQESIKDFAQRLGIWRNLPKGNVIWLHGASNGEMTSARGLIEGVLQQNPDAQLLLSCNSVSAKQMMLQWGLANTHIRLAPLDLRWIYRALFARMGVKLFIVLEADFWPNRTVSAQRMGIPTALVAGRISANSAKSWQKFPNFSAQVFQSFDLVCPQDADSQERLKDLGVPNSTLGAQISLKSLYQSSHVKRDHSSRAAYWLAASTHQGEDETLLRAHLIAQKQAPDLRMILAPRHPKRGDAIAQSAQTLGLNVTQRSKGASLSGASDVYIADSLGEMALWYEAAASCFVAGSLVDKGGHTPFEPMTHDCAILHGPHVENFAPAYAALSKNHGALRCETPEGIAENLILLLDETTAQEKCARAREALGKHDALEPVLAALSQIVQT